MRRYSVDLRRLCRIFCSTIVVSGPDALRCRIPWRNVSPPSSFSAVGSDDNQGAQICALVFLDPGRHLARCANSCETHVLKWHQSIVEHGFECCEISFRNSSCKTPAIALAARREAVSKRSVTQPKDRPRLAQCAQDRFNAGRADSRQACGNGGLQRPFMGCFANSGIDDFSAQADTENEWSPCAIRFALQAQCRCGLSHSLLSAAHDVHHAH